MLQVIEQRENRKPLIAYFDGIKLAYKRNATITETPTKVFTLRSQLIDRLKNNECELCGKLGSIDMHHVNKLKNIRKYNRKNKAEWMEQMIAMNRKTFAVCV